MEGADARARERAQESDAELWPPLQLSRETLVDRVTNQLRQQILSGRLQPGTQMPTEKAICEAFGVGRTTIREALHGLVSSGFLERKSNQLIVRGRAQIPDHDADIAALAARMSVHDVFEARKLLETKAVALAALHWADGDIELLRAALERMRTALTPGHHDGDFHAADVAFHTAVVRVAKNPVLEHVYENSKSLFFKLPAFWRVFAGPTETSRETPRSITGFDGHREIVDAIERRDAAEAARLSDGMLDRVAATLIDRVERARSAQTAPSSHGTTTPTHPPTPLLNIGGH